jgi:hypothetical protein
MSPKTITCTIQLNDLRDAVNEKLPELFRDIMAALEDDYIREIIKTRYSWPDAVVDLAKQEGTRRGVTIMGWWPTNSVNVRRQMAAPSRRYSQQRAWDDWTVGSIVNFGFCEVEIVEIREFPRLHFWGETTANRSPMTFTPYHGNSSGWITPEAA